MSDSDSFIDEVNEEVRRDRLFALMRRYGWIAGALVVLIVGAAGWNEWRKANAQAEARALGDAVLDAVEEGDAASRAMALGAVEAEGPAATVVGLLAASERIEAGDAAAAAEFLRPLALDAEAAPEYSDLAALKLVLLGEAAGLEPGTRAQLLERLSQPGAPYRMIALEQRALDLAAAGRRQDAIDAASDLIVEQGVTQGMQRRLLQLIVGLGGDPAEIVGAGAGARAPADAALDAADPAAPANGDAG